MVEDAAESLSKTKAAIELLKKVGALADATKAKESKNLRRGKGKMRNRRYVNRKGPLIVYDQDNGITKAFRNLPGVDILPVSALNLLHVRLAWRLPAWLGASQPAWVILLVAFIEGTQVIKLVIRGKSGRWTSICKPGGWQLALL